MNYIKLRRKGIDFILLNNLELLKKLTLIFFGICIGLGSYTFYYARAYSYLFDNPGACINCHVMKEHYEAWENSSHHSVAVCNDCHLPHHNMVNKYFSKGLIGSRHSFYFTFGNFPEPIRIGKESRKIAEENCIRCHTHMVGDINETHKEKLECTSCHDSVGHKR